MATTASTPRRRIERAMSLASGKPVAHIDEQRQCVYPSCVTRLSRYNPNPCCAAHGGWMDDQERRKSRTGR